MPIRQVKPEDFHPIGGLYHDSAESETSYANDQDGLATRPQSPNFGIALYRTNAHVATRMDRYYFRFRSAVNRIMSTVEGAWPPAQPVQRREEVSPDSRWTSEQETGALSPTLSAAETLIGLSQEEEADTIPLDEPEVPPAVATTRTRVDLIVPTSSPPYEASLDLRIPLHFHDHQTARFEPLTAVSQGSYMREAFEAANQDLAERRCELYLGRTYQVHPFSTVSPPYFRVVLCSGCYEPKDWTEVHGSVMETLREHFGQYEEEFGQEFRVRYFMGPRSTAGGW